MKLMPGETISYEVFYLEMKRAPNFTWPQKPAGDVFILRAVKPSSRYFFDLYAAVGANHEWTDKYDLPINEIDEFISNPLVQMFTFFKDGWTAGFFILDSTIDSVCDLAYFGLVPEVIGCGYGEYLLKFAVKMGWKSMATRLLTVNTNTLDHPNALPLYKKVGFKLKRSEAMARTLTKQRVIKKNII